MLKFEADKMHRQQKVYLEFSNNKTAIEHILWLYNHDNKRGTITGTFLQLQLDSREVTRTTDDWESIGSEANVNLYPQRA